MRTLLSNTAILIFVVAVIAIALHEWLAFKPAPFWVRRLRVRLKLIWTGFRR